MGYRVGVDIGGTFTDFTIVDDAGNLTLWKEDSNPEDPASAIAVGLEAVGTNLGLDGMRQLLEQTDQFVHGSTIATNTLIQRNGPTVGLLCTKGFRDVIYFRDGFKWERFNVHLPRPADFVDRYLRLGVAERINYAGEILTPLDEADVRDAAAKFRSQNVKAITVAFLWSVINPGHEKRAAEILAEELPGVPVLCSADVLPEIREWERTSATVLSAYILPKIGDYLTKFESMLGENGMTRKPLIMQSNGGCASVAEILRRPVYALASGPAAAPAAATHHARGLGDDNLITIDMGGTSFDVCLIRNGRAARSRKIQVEYQPIGVSAVEVHSIGAGGGSIAWIDSGSALRVGPRSAGARPGPACYGSGGEEPTVTDANVVLGYLSPTAFLGGRRVLREDLAEEAVTSRVGRPLGLSALQAAAGIVQVVNSNMADGIRAVSVERGIDPRGFTLVSGGGAGGLHAARLGRQIGMARVVIPREASTFCAFGMTVTDVRHDYTRTLHQLSSTLDVKQLDEMYAELEREARERLREDGFVDDQIVIERYVDARYPNQVHELTVPIPGVARYSAEDVRTIETTFHDEHDQQFTYALRDLPVEFLHWRLTGIGRTPALPVASEVIVRDGRRAGEEALIETRDAYFEEDGAKVPTKVYSADALLTGAIVDGPAIIQSPITTVVINRGDVLTARAGGAFLIEIAKTG